ncbi:mitochondrial carrier domain-containing protein [Limtongia smithiae]|uniref:mitochondrial carrier domain-containing protein n=1 Tax=Limtongia smithiae TaxID=1125753 RepID=UPI0034CDE76F
MDLATVTAAVAGGVGSAFMFYPLDTVLTIRQTSTNGVYSLPFTHYWRGVTVSTLFSAPAFAVYLVAYRQTKRELSAQFGASSALTYVLSGLAAEIASSVIWTPMEVIKGHMQITHGAGVVSSLSVIRRIYQTEGYRGFFRGYGLGLAMYGPSSVCYWYIYENAKTYFRRRHMNSIDKSALPDSTTSYDLTTVEYSLSSFAAVTCSESVFNFFDVVRTRQQMALSEEVRRIRPNDHTSLLTVARNLIAEAGLFRAMIKGLHIRLMYALPTGMLSMVIVETIKPDIADDDDFDI